MPAVIVTAPLVIVDVDGLKQYFYKSVVPVEIPKSEAARLTDLGLVVASDVPIAVPALGVNEAISEAVAETTLERPARAASKEAWVEYAVAKGVDRELAEESTKTELIAEFD